MMKYLKAEAEIIKFDNSDVVTLSYDCQEGGKECAQNDAPDHVNCRGLITFIFDVIDWFFNAYLPDIEDDGKYNGSINNNSSNGGATPTDVNNDW